MSEILSDFLCICMPIHGRKRSIRLADGEIICVTSDVLGNFMKRISAFIFLVIFSSSASAGWAFINSNSMNSIYFLNYQTLKVRPPYVQVWGLVNYGKPMESGINSEKSLYLFYCSEDKYKYLTSIYFSERDASGSVVSQMDEETDWLHIAPDSIIGAVSEAACAAARRKK